MGLNREPELAGKKMRLTPTSRTDARLGAKAAVLLVALLLAACAGPRSKPDAAQDGAGTEKRYGIGVGDSAEPELAANALAPRDLRLSGPGYKVRSPVQVAGYMGQFVIDTPEGSIDAAGSALLRLRIAELPALAKLEEVSATEVFVDALARGVRDTGRAVQRVVTQPIETVKGIPAGIGRLFQRTIRTVRRVAGNVGDALDGPDDDRGDDEGGPTRTERAIDFTKEYAGINKARREIAKTLGIDPYTGNPMLQDELEELAYASVAGGMSFKLALGQVGGLAADVLSVSGRLDDLVWDADPDQIREQLTQRLARYAIDPDIERRFFKTAAFTPTLQLGFVEALEALGAERGHSEALALAATVKSEVHARFLIQQLQMFRRHGFARDSVVEIVALERSLAALTGRGSWFVALPVDYLSWTGSFANVAQTRDDLPSQRKVVVSGKVSPRARQELSRRGFEVVAEVGFGQR